jgi:hypothetical protein
MKRFALKLVLFLLLGAIINVAVAWGVVLWPSNFHEIAKADLSWPIRSPDGYHYSPQYAFGISSWGTTHLGAWVDTDFGYSGRMDVRAAGWPARTLYAERHSVKAYVGLPGLTIFNKPNDIWDGVGIPTWLSRLRLHDCFPTRPLWPGFAINTIFYAAILWLPFAALGTFRRRRRIKRGLCPKCGYDLRGHNIHQHLCPECGNSAGLLHVRDGRESK